MLYCVVVLVMMWLFGSNCLGQGLIFLIADSTIVWLVLCLIAKKFGKTRGKVAVVQQPNQFIT